jgi:alpha-glucoside transport system substrate-binding protein
VNAQRKSHRRARGTAGLAISAALALSTLAACGPPAAGTHVTILVAWSGTELTAFQDTVIRGFEAAYPGTTVQVESTRALETELGADLQQGDPPDIAALPSIGAIGQYTAQDALQPLNGLVSTRAYGDPWSSLIRPQAGGPIYAVPVKADVKSLIWYDPTALRQDAPGARPPATLTQLTTLSQRLARSGRQPWCLAVSSPPTSGWPGADWIADLILASDGPATYQQWADGQLSWTSPQVTRAWQAWNSIIGLGAARDGNRASALTAAIGSLQPSARGCLLSHGTLVDQGFPATDRYGSDYAFVPFPSASGAIQVSADFVGMFRATPAARNLIRYMTSTAAQEAWVGFPGADGFSPSSQVPPAAYPNAVTRSIAALLTSGRELCFGAADAMAPDLGAAFDHAALWDLAQPSALTTAILPGLARVPSSASSPPAVCGKPSR